MVSPVSTENDPLKRGSRLSGFHFLIAFMDKKSLKSAAEMPDELKTPVAKIYEALHDRGVSRADFIESLESAGFSIPPRQLDRWVEKTKTTGSAIMENKESGGPPRLDREKRDITSGWVLHEYATGTIVSIESFYTFVFDNFGIKLSNGTIFSYLSEDGFSSRVVKKKGMSFVVDIDALRKWYWNWTFIQDFRGRGIRLEDFGSIDFVFTGHKTEMKKSYAPRGAPQPMITEKISSFTNCIITVLWADGKNWTPPMLFTFNPAFRTDRAPTERRSKQVDYFHECLDKYGINQERVKYIGKDKLEMKKYARECPDLVRLFFEYYKVRPNCTIYSDEGNSFFDGGKSALLEVGFYKHRCYPSKIHQYASPNDNPLHGTAKQSWRHSKLDHSDDVGSSLALLSYLDRDIIKYSKHWWDRNLISITEEGVNDLIGEGPVKLSREHKTWKRSYQEFMNKNND